MNAEQKKRIAHEISNWKNACNCRAVQLTGDRMAALLQELVDAPEVLTTTNPAQISSLAEPFGYFKAEPFGWTDCAETDDGAIALYTAPPAQSVPEAEPVARVTGYYAGYLSIATVDGRVLSAGTALYAAPQHQSEHHLEMVNTPAPIVPDGWIRAIDEAMVVHHIGIADRADSYEVAKKKLNALLAINSDIARDCSEAPADVVRDAEPFAVIHLDGSFVHVEFKQSVASSGKFTVYTAPQPPKLSDERILEIYAETKANWNAQADQCNQWSDLGVDEVVTLVARAIEREILGGGND